MSSFWRMAARLNSELAKQLWVLQQTRAIYVYTVCSRVEQTLSLPPIHTTLRLGSEADCSPTSWC